MCKLMPFLYVKHIAGVCVNKLVVSVLPKRNVCLCSRMLLFRREVENDGSS